MPFLQFAESYQGVGDVFMGHPDRYLSFMEFIAEIMEGDLEPTRVEREMIALRVSSINGCVFCIKAHHAVLLAMGSDPDEIAAAERGEIAVENMPRLSIALAFAEKLTRSPGKIIQDDVNSMVRRGWSEQGVEDIIDVIGAFSFFNRLADGFGIEGSPDYFDQIGPMLAQGYRPIVAMMRKKINSTSS